MRSIEPGISRIPGLVLTHHPGMTASDVSRSLSRASSRHRAAAPPQPDILQLGQGADRDRLRRDKGLAEQVRCHRTREYLI